MAAINSVSNVISTAEIKAAKQEKPDSILLEADQIVNGRQRGYEDPVASFENIAAIASAIRRKPITARDCSAILIALKLSRESFSHKRDNLVDACGYLEIDNILAEQGYE